MAGAKVSTSSSPGRLAALNSKVSVTATPPLSFFQTWGKKALQMVRLRLCCRNRLTSAGEFDIRLSGTCIPHSLAKSSCTDLLLMNREAEYLFTTLTGRASIKYITEYWNQRYSPSANFLSDSDTLGLMSAGCGLRTQTTSPASTECPPKFNDVAPLNEIDACCFSIAANPPQHATSYPACSAAHLMGAV